MVPYFSCPRQYSKSSQQVQKPDVNPQWRVEKYDLIIKKQPKTMPTHRLAQSEVAQSHTCRDSPRPCTHWRIRAAPMSPCITLRFSTDSATLRCGAPLPWMINSSHMSTTLWFCSPSRLRISLRNASHVSCMNA